MINKTILLIVFLVTFFGISFCQEKKVELKEVVSEFQKNNFERVIELADRAIKEGSQQPELYFYLGFSYMKISKNSEAINFLKLFLKNAEYTQKNIWMLKQGLQNLVTLHKNNKDFKSVLNDVNDSLGKIRSGNLSDQLEGFCKNIIVEAFREIGNKKAEAGDYAGAIEVYKKLLEYRPDDSSVFSRIAVYYKNLAQNEMAAEYYLKSAMNWSAWSSKLSPLVSAVELLWETDKFGEFSKKIETDSISHNFMLAAKEMKEKMYSEAFSRLRKLDDNIGSKGDFSERLLRVVHAKRPDDPWMFYFFIINFPEHAGSRWAADMLINLGRNNYEIEKTIKEKMLSALRKLVDESASTEVRKLFPKVNDMQFLGTSESREVAVEKIKILEQFAAKYPEDPIIPDILKHQASLYVDNLFDYKKGKEIYGVLVKKYSQKNLSVQLAKCFINLGEMDEAINIIRQFVADKEIGENLKFQAGQLLLQSNYFDEGMKILKEIDDTTKNRWLKQQIADTIKDFRQYLEEDIAIETMGKFLILNTNHKEYYFTNFTSIDENSPLLFQVSENIEIVPFSNKKENISCFIECNSRDEISFTQPHFMVFKKGNFYTSSFKKIVSFSSDKWRRIEGISVIFPWQDIKTDKIRITRDYKVQEDTAISTISFIKLKPGAKIELTFSPRVGKFESVSPESTGPGFAGSMIFNPSDENFEIKVKFKPVPELLAYYPKVRVIYEEKEKILQNSNMSKFVVNPGKSYFNITFDSEINVHSIMKARETIYEVEEKIDI